MSGGSLYILPVHTAVKTYGRIEIIRHGVAVFKKTSSPHFIAHIIKNPAGRLIQRGRILRFDYFIF